MYIWFVKVNICFLFFLMFIFRLYITPTPELLNIYVQTTKLLFRTKTNKRNKKEGSYTEIRTFHFSLLTKIFYYLVPVIEIRIWDILKILNGNFRFFFLYLFFKENSKWISFLFSWSKIVHKKIQNKDYDLGIFYFYPHWYLKVSHTTLIDLLTTLGSISSNTSIFKKGNDNTKFYLMIMDHND